MHIHHTYVDYRGYETQTIHKIEGGEPTTTKYKTPEKKPNW